MRTKRDYYEVLGVGREAESDEIKRAYRKLAVKYHPDKNPGDAQAEERFKELGEAYDVLMDENKRAAYDRYGHAAFSQGAGAGGGGFHDPFDLFREVFGAAGGAGGMFDHFFGGGSSREAGGRQRGRDLRYDLQISLEEAAAGCEKEIQVRKLDTCSSCSGSGAKAGSRAVTCPVCRGAGQVVSSRGFFQVAQTCPNCRGTGSVIEKPCEECGGEGRRERVSKVKLRIPPGVDDGSRMRVPGGGEAGVRGGSSGDIYVVLHVAQHRIFEREGADLHCKVPVPFHTAALGGEISVPSLTGPIDLKIPAGTQSGSSFRVRGQGMPVLQSSSRGDLFIRVDVEVPTKLNAEQRKKLEEFAELCGDHNSPIHKTFYERLKELFTGE